MVHACGPQKDPQMEGVTCMRRVMLRMTGGDKIRELASTSDRVRKYILRACVEFTRGSRSSSSSWHDDDAANDVGDEIVTA